jgi:hypothetical protein
VPEDVIRRLNDHHQNVADYIMGFFTFLDLRQRCEDVESALQDVAAGAEEAKLRANMRRDLRDIQQRFVPRPRWHAEFEQELTDFSANLREALDVVGDPAGFFGPVSSLAESRITVLRNVGRMSEDAGTVQGKCESRCREELAALAADVSWVFGRLEVSSKGQARGVNKPEVGPTSSQGSTQEGSSQGFSAPKRGDANVV